MFLFSTFFLRFKSVFAGLCLSFLGSGVSQAQFYINTLKLEKLTWITPATESILNTGSSIGIEIKAQCDAALNESDFEVWIDNTVTDIDQSSCENNTFKGVIKLPGDKVHTLFVKVSKGATVKQTTVLTIIPPEKANIPVSVKDVRDIKNRAIALINDLTKWYNDILSSNSLERKDLINNMIVPGEDQIFMNDQVNVEDDFDTRGKVPKNERDKKVEKYFSDIGAYFGMLDNGNYRNESEIISLTNFTTTNVRPDKRASMMDPLYIDVHFTVNYRGVDSRTQQSFKSVKRLAELEARNDPKSGSWRLYIRSLRFDTAGPNTK